MRRLLSETLESNSHLVFYELIFNSRSATIKVKAEEEEEESDKKEEKKDKERKKGKEERLSAASSGPIKQDWPSTRKGGGLARLRAKQRRRRK